MVMVMVMVPTLSYHTLVTLSSTYLSTYLPRYW